MSTVLINGIGSALGAQVARQLSAHDGVTVLGLARCEPSAPVGCAEWLVAHLSGLQLIELLRAEHVDTLIHLDFAGADAPAEGREAAVQQNVLGTMEVLGACIAAGVSHVVVRSHVGIYGANPKNPIMLSESRPAARGGLSGLLRDLAEVEHFLAEFTVRHPEISVAILRFAPIVGGWSPLLEYFAQPSPRTLIGFDPSMQLLHIDDAANAIVLAALSPCAGAFNLAADDAVCISQAIRLSGQQPVPTIEALIGLSASMGDRTKLRPWPFDISFLRHSCVVDTRRVKDVLGWSPTHSAVDSIHSARKNGRAIDDPATSEAAMRAFLSRKG